MADENEILKTLSVESFPVPVLGGTFHIDQVVVEEGASGEMAVAAIRNTPEDRWFVMSSENPETEKDSLAMIDENFDFKVFALGMLEQD